MASTQDLAILRAEIGEQLKAHRARVEEVAEDLKKLTEEVGNPFAGDRRISKIADDMDALQVRVT